MASSSSNSGGKSKSLTNGAKKKIKKKSSSSTKTSLKMIDEHSKKVGGSRSQVNKQKSAKKHKAIKISAMTNIGAMTMTTTTIVQETQEVPIKQSLETKEKKHSPKKLKTKHSKSTKISSNKPFKHSLSRSSLKDDESLASSISANSLYQAKLNELNYLNMRLDDLNAQLAYLKSNDIVSDPNSFHPELKPFIDDINELEDLAEANLFKLKFLYDKELCDIERQYECETSRARQEFQDKRVELKETLKQEQEEARKKCLDIADLTINYDDDAYICSSHAKRKLRRRCRNVNLNIDHLLDSPTEYGQFFK